MLFKKWMQFYHKVDKEILNLKLKLKFIGLFRRWMKCLSKCSIEFTKSFVLFRKLIDFLNQLLNLNLSHTGSRNEKLWQDSMHWCELRVLNIYYYLKLSKHYFLLFQISMMFAEAVRRTHNGESVSYLFSNVPYWDTRH